MNKQSLAAINKAITEIHGDDFDLTIEGGEVSVSLFTTFSQDLPPDAYFAGMKKGRYLDKKIQVVQTVSGRWVIAFWSKPHNQWQSSDFTKSFKKYNESCCYVFANTVEKLIGDINAYRSAAAAIRVAIQ